VRASRSSPGSVSAYYEGAALGYSARRDRGLAGLVRRREQAAVLGLLAAGAGDRVLDVGCGDGAVAGLLVERGVWVVAADLTLAMAWAARRRGAAAVVADMRALPFRAGFDGVACVGASEFVPLLREAVAAFAGCLRPSGELVLLVPRRNWLGWALWLFHRINGVPVHLRSRLEVSRSLVAAGFEPPGAWQRCAAAWVGHTRLAQPEGDRIR
jgi:SAM-dependent methyltransferase